MITINVDEGEVTPKIADDNWTDGGDGTWSKTFVVDGANKTYT